MYSAASVCQHDNFRTIQRRMMELNGGYVHCTKISPEFECQGHPGQKKRQNAESSPL